MSGKVSSFRKALNIMRGRHARENPDGTITTKFGDRVIPYRIDVSGRGVTTANPGEFLFQPRTYALEKQLEPLLTAPENDLVAVDRESGEFFLKSDLEKNGRDGVAVLGRVDLALEEELLSHAAMRVRMRKLWLKARPARNIFPMPKLPPGIG